MNLSVLDLFSAACGGWSLGMHRAGFRTVAACEFVPWRRALYSENNPEVLIYDDVRTLTADRIVSDLGYFPRIVVGSPPCQDISSANTKGKGVEGERSGLFFEAIRIVGEGRPAWVALENSANLRTRGADRVIAALEALGYTVWTFVVGASDVGANHERKRSWIIAFDPAQIGHDGWGTRRYGTHGYGAAYFGECSESAHTTEGGYARVERDSRQCRGESSDHAQTIAGSDVADACEAIATGRLEIGGRRRGTEGLEGIRSVRCVSESEGVRSRHTPGDGWSAGRQGRRAEPDEGIPVETCGNGSHADEDGEYAGALNGEVGERESVGADASEPWPDWNSGFASYLRMDARLSAWAFLAILLKEGGYLWAGERLISAVKSAGFAATPSIEEDLGSVLKTLLASSSESTVRRLAPIAKILSGECNITIALAPISREHAKFVAESNDSPSIIAMKSGRTMPRKTSKRSVLHATAAITCEPDLQAVHRQAERRMRRFEGRQVEAFGDAVVPQIPEAIGRAILRVERAYSIVRGQA